MKNVSPGIMGSSPVAVSSPPGRSIRAVDRPYRFIPRNPKQKVSKPAQGSGEILYSRKENLGRDIAAPPNSPPVLRAGPFLESHGASCRAVGGSERGPYPHFRITSSSCSMGMAHDGSRNAVVVTFQ